MDGTGQKSLVLEEYFEVTVIPLGGNNKTVQKVTNLSYYFHTNIYGHLCRSRLNYFVTISYVQKLALFKHILL